MHHFVLTWGDAHNIVVVLNRANDESHVSVKYLGSTRFEMPVIGKGHTVSE